MSNAVEIVLDLRQLEDRPQSPDAFIRFWSSIETVLNGRKLTVGDRRPIEFPGRGTLNFEVISVPGGSATITDRTSFAIHSILEPASAEPICRLCFADGLKNYGPFVCDSCRQSGIAAAICVRHAEILEGGLRRGGWVIASCREHAPVCNKCGRRASFWCTGPECRGRVTWCPEDRKSHANSPEIGYCATCYELLFPQCSRSNCREPGTNICEHVDAKGQFCGKKLCNRHVARWQVYGYERIGLGRCDVHRLIKDLPDVDLMWQVVAGTVIRNAQKGGAKYRLPTLGSVKNILLKGRRQFYDEQIARNLYEQLRARLREEQGRSQVHVAMLRLLDRASAEWNTRLAAAEVRNRDGLVYLDRLKSNLRTLGFGDIADQVEMTSFIPTFIKAPTPQSCLFVKMPQTAIGRFMGKGGSRKDWLAQTIGCAIRLEKGL